MTTKHLKEIQELKDSILHFRIQDLLKVFSQTDLSRRGRKHELQKRLVRYLDSGPSEAVINKIRVVKNNIMISPPSPYDCFNLNLQPSQSGRTGLRSSSRETNSSVTSSNTSDEIHQFRSSGSSLASTTGLSSLALSPAAPTSTSLQQYAMRNNHQHDTMINPSNNVIFTIRSFESGTIRMPKFPRITLQESPYHKVQSCLYPLELLVPVDVEMTPRVNRRIYEKTVCFNLSPEQTESIVYHRKVQGTRIDFEMQVLVRFVQLDPDTVQASQLYSPVLDDNLPIHVAMAVNGKAVNLPPTMPSNKPGLEGRRPPKSVNITHLVRISPVVSNQVKIQWMHVGSYHAVSVLLAKKATTAELCSQLVSKQTKTADYSRSLIRKKLNASTDDDIMMSTSLQASLLCPLGKSRIVLPVRSRHCSHIQCFDAGLYLAMNERKASWRCPSCDGSARIEDLFVDSLFTEILTSPRSKDVDDVVFRENGSWDPVSSEPPATTSTSPRSSPCFVVSSPSSKKKRNGGGAGRVIISASCDQPMTVDLTESTDEEDDEGETGRQSRASSATTLAMIESPSHPPKLTKQKRTRSKDIDRPPPSLSVITLSDDSDVSLGAHDRPSFNFNQHQGSLPPPTLELRIPSIESPRCASLIGSSDSHSERWSPANMTLAAMKRKYSSPSPHSTGRDSTSPAKRLSISSPPIAHTTLPYSNPFIGRTPAVPPANHNFPFFQRPSPSSPYQPHNLALAPFFSTIPDTGLPFSFGNDSSSSGSLPSAPSFSSTSTNGFPSLFYPTSSTSSSNTMASPLSTAPHFVPPSASLWPTLFPGHTRQL